MEQAMSVPFDPETERVRRLFDALAPSYDWEIVLWEQAFYRGCRRWVCSQAAGEVLEIAIGTGRNLRFYSPAVRLTGIELSEAMLVRARRRARALKRRVDLRLGDAQALEFPDRSFDTVVCSIALCAIPDPRKAVAEVRRVLKPGGRLLLFEHARSPCRPVRLLQRFLATFSPRLGGHYLLRDPVDCLAEAGFEIEHLRRLKLGIVQRISARRCGSAGGEDGAARPALGSEPCRIGDSSGSYLVRSCPARARYEPAEPSEAAALSAMNTEHTNPRVCFRTSDGGGQ